MAVVESLTPLQRAEALARRHFPHAKRSQLYGSVIYIETDELPPGTSIIAASSKVAK